jgi:hypothetical protein
MQDVNRGTRTRSVCPGHQVVSTARAGLRKAAGSRGNDARQRRQSTWYAPAQAQENQKTQQLGLEYVLPAWLLSPYPFSRPDWFGVAQIHKGLCYPDPGCESLVCAAGLDRQRGQLDHAGHVSGERHVGQAGLRPPLAQLTADHGIPIDSQLLYSVP